MSRSLSGLRPRISLGVTHVKQNLEELLADLQEPITLTVGGSRLAVLVPYRQYMEMVRALAEVEELSSTHEPRSDGDED